MDNEYDKKYSHCQCEHGKCKDHKAQWEIAGELRREPVIWMFGIIKKWWSAHYCCGEAMVCYQDKQKMKCALCGRIEDIIRNEYVGVCKCCGDVLVMSDAD